MAIVMPFITYRIFGWLPSKIDDSWDIKTIKNGLCVQPCYSCRCEKCHFIFMDIRYDESELGKLYRDYRLRQYDEERNLFEPGYSARNSYISNGITYMDKVESFIAKYLQRCDVILDYGGDTGINTPFKSLAKEVDIFDISQKKIQSISALNSTSYLNESKNYDLIVLANVIEHVSSPREIMDRLAGLMNSETVLYLETPYERVAKLIDSGDKTINDKKHWHEHINFFNEKSLNKLFELTNFEVIGCERIDENAGGNWDQFFQYALKRKKCI